MNTQIEQAIQYRDNYQDYIASLPASIYNNNIEIYQANLERMNQEIDRLIEEAEVSAQLSTLTPTTTEADADALHDLLEALDNGDWLGEVTARQYGDADLTKRRDNLLYALNDEPCTREQADAAISELAELEAKINGGISSPAWWDAQEERSL